MPTVAAQLRAAREAQGLTIQQVAEITKIKTDHIRALEEGDYGAFAAPVYIRGFVRNAARVLKLEVSPLMTALDSELGRTPQFREPPPLTDEGRGFLDVLMLQLSKVNWRVAMPVILITAGLLIGLISFRSWSKQPAKDPLSNLEPAMYTAPSSQPGDTLPLPSPTSAKK
jgi:cytoskeleton protein RodZ